MVDDRMIILNTLSLKHPLTLKSSTDTIGCENVCVCVCVCGLMAVIINTPPPPPPPAHTDPP